MPQVFSSISRGSFSGIFPKKLPPNLAEFVSVENLNKGSKRVETRIIPGTSQWIIFPRRWNARIFGLAMVVLSRFPVRTGLTGGLGGAVWGSCDCDVVVGSQPFEGNKQKENNTREKVFKDLPVSDAQKKHVGLPGNKEHALKTS